MRNMEAELDKRVVRAMVARTIAAEIAPVAQMIVVALAPATRIMAETVLLYSAHSALAMKQA